MEKEDSWTLRTNSPYLEELFEFKDILSTINASKSFSRKLSDAINLETFLKQIRPFSKYMEVKRSFHVGQQEKVSTIYVFEVDVVLRKDGMAVVERVCSTSINFHSYFISINNRIIIISFNISSKHFLILIHELIS